MNIIKYSLFPTLVLYFSGFINSKECNKIFKLLKTKKLNGHSTLINGKSSHITDLDILAETSLDLTIPIQEYSKQSKIKMNNKITNSWFNIQDKESVLKEHSHPNSLVSGAIFINVDLKSSKLYFYNPNPLVYYMPKANSGSEYTQEWCSFRPKKGDLILFPSWLRHGAHYDKNFSNKRTVISFNTI
mgnify:FL=1